MSRGAEKSEPGKGLPPEMLRRSLDEETGFRRIRNISADWKNIHDSRVTKYFKEQE